MITRPTTNSQYVVYAHAAVLADTVDPCTVTARGCPQFVHGPAQGGGLAQLVTSLVASTKLINAGPG